MSAVASSIITSTARAARADTDEGLQEVLDFLVTEEQLGLPFVTAAIERAAGTPFEAFVPVLSNAVTTEFPHVEALTAAGGRPRTTSYWFPDTAFDRGGVGLFSTLESVESVEIRLALLGVSADARAGEAFGARRRAEAMGTEAVHRALARFAQGPPGRDFGVPNDGGFENCDGPTVAEVRDALEGLGIGDGARGPGGAGACYDDAGHPVARGVGTPVSHPTPA